jgi:TatD DNase family protein
MGLIDSHAHLTYAPLCGQLEAVMQRCAEAGVERVITVGTDACDARAAVALSEQYPGRIHAAVGIHPHHAGEATDETIEEIAALWRSGGAVAAGEMGLDYHYDFADRAVQRRVFEEQLERCRPLELPVVIHARESIQDIVPILLQRGFGGRRVVFHCFTGTAAEAGIIAEHGWRISFTGIVTFKNSEWLQEIARGYRDDWLMVETDAPYLSPEPVRRKHPNEPAHVVHTAAFLAALRGVSEEEFQRQTYRNTREFFCLA